MELVRCKDHRLRVEQTEVKNAPWREGYPATSTSPLGSRVAECKYLVVCIGIVAEKLPAAGLYSSAVPRYV